MRMALAMAMSQTLQKVERDCDFGVSDEFDKELSLSYRNFFAGRKSLRVRKKERKKERNSRRPKSVLGV